MSEVETTWFAHRLRMLKEGRGCYLTDSDGKQYIDGSGGAAFACLGHGHPEVNAAIMDQLARFAHGYRYHFTSEPLEQLERLVGRQAGGDLQHMVFVASGSEAVESCLKIALQYQHAIGQPSRRRFIARQRSYHGNTLGALSVSGFARRRAPFEGSLLEVSKLSQANVYRPPEGLDPTAIAEYCAEELEAEILRLGPENVCAFVFEPVVGAAGGVIPAPPGYARLMQEVCRRYGVLLIADEVMCGTGRTGTWRALDYDGVEPDAMAIAKGLAGGYIPLGAAVYRWQIHESIVDAHGHVLTGHTFTGHTTACAAGLAVQRIIQRDGLVERVRRDGAWFLEALRAELGDHPYVGDIRGRGFFAGVEFVADRQTKEPFDLSARLNDRLWDASMNNGLICYPVSGTLDGRVGDVAILAPPYNATRDELQEIVDRFVTTCRQALPG